MASFIRFIEPFCYRYSNQREKNIMGERLFMSDGSIWFHPYGGDAPMKE